MLFFELKKTYKNKLFIILLLFSIIISLYNVAINGPIDISIVNEFDSGYGSLLHGLSFDSEIIKDLSDEDKEKIVNEYMDYNKDFRYPWEDKENDEEYALRLAKAYRKNYLYEDNMIKKYNIKLDSKTQKVWDWGLFESKYMIDTKTPVSESLMSSVSKNPLRTIIYNDNLIFGTSIIILIIFVFSGIISKEKESNTIFLLKGQPISKSKIIFAKWINIIIYGILFVISTVLLTIFFFYLHGYKWYNCHLEIYRIFSDNNLDYTIAYKLLIQIFFASAIMIAFFASIVILFSTLFKNKYLPAIIISLILILFTIINNKYDIFRSLYNPFYLLNFKNILNGFISFDEELQIKDFQYIKPYGFYPYLIYFVLSIGILTLSIYVLDKEISFSKSKNRSSKIKSVFAFEYFKIVKDKSFLVIFIGTLSIFLVLFVDIYIKNNKAENVLFSKHNTPLMNYYISSKIVPIESEIDRKIIERDYFLEIDGEEKYKKKLKILQQKLKQEEENLDNYRIESQYYKNKDGKNFYQLRVNQINDLLKNPYIVIAVKLKNMNFTPASHRETLALYKYMAENNSEPKVLAWPVFASDYEEKTMMNEIDGFDNVFDHSASYIFRKFSKTLPIDLLILFMVSFMVLGGYTYDKENGSQIDFLYTQPLRKEKLYLLKVLSAFVISLLVLSAIFLFISFLGLITKGIGDLNYPIVQYDKLLNPTSIQMDTPDYFLLIPVWLYNFRLYLILALQLIFIISIGNFISMFTKSRFNVFFGSLSIIIIGMMASMKLPDNIRLYSPFNYMNARYIANGAVKIKENLAGANIRIIIAVILVSTVFINILGMFLLKKVEQ